MQCSISYRLELRARRGIVTLVNNDPFTFSLLYYGFLAFGSGFDDL